MADMPTQNWVYQARLLRVIDGDTVALELDLGHTVHVVPSLRLAGLNAPELHAADPMPGQASKKYVEDWIAAAIQSTSATDWPFVVYTQKAEKYGRFLGTVWRRRDGRELNADILADGFAVPMAA